jgi:hypothetical protein
MNNLNTDNANKFKINQLIETKLKESGVEFVRFVDITSLSDKENKNYPTAILFGISLSSGFLQQVMNTPDYVEEMVRCNSDFFLF